MKPLVIIPARGGSKGVPGKNIKLLNGKPLIHYTIEAALEVFSKDQILVSTDSEEIKSVSEECGITVPFLRPAELATDTSSSYDVLLHAVDFAAKNGMDFDTVVLLQPTSPLRKAEHITGTMDAFEDSLDMVVSVKIADANPYYSLFEENNDGLLTKSKEGNFTRRQDCPEVYEYNGAVYVINKESLLRESLGAFKRVKKFIMPAEASLDIDTDLDWKIVELILRN